MADANESEIGFSYELGVQVDVSAHGEEEKWIDVRFAKSLAPTQEAKTQDGATYDDKGADHPIKTGESWSLAMEVQQHRMEDGSYLPEIEALKARTEPDARGNQATAHIRWFDKPATGKPNPNDAYEGYGTVSITRSDTSVNGLGGWNITITGQGPRTRIRNPLAAPDPAAPKITGITPAGKKVGEEVTIAGSNFTGVTAVRFGKTLATVFTVDNATNVKATIPTGTPAGAVKVRVYGPKGESNAFDYTVVAA